MATIFASPEIGAPEATPPRNGGIRQRTRDIVYPVSNCTEGQFTQGKRVEFRFRSDSSRFVSFRDTNLVVRLETKFIPARQHATDASKRHYSGNKDALRNVRFTAAPCTSLFSQGMEYLCNSVTIENQSKPYEAAMLNLLTKGDSYASATSGSNSLLDLSKGCEVDRKRVTGGLQGAIMLEADTVPDDGNPIAFAVGGNIEIKKTISVSNADATVVSVGSVIQFPSMELKVLEIGAADSGVDATGANAGGTTALHVMINDDPSLFFTTGSGTSAALSLSEGFNGRVYGGTNTAFDSPAMDAYQTKPKHEMLSANLVEDTSLGGFTAHTEISEPVMLQSWQHGWACPGADHQLFLQISNKWHEDLFYEAEEINPRAESVLVEGALAADRVDTAIRADLHDGCGSQYNFVVDAGSGFKPASQVAVGQLGKASGDAGFICTRVTGVELHVGYVSPIVPFVPRSVSWAWSSIEVNLLQVKSARIMESIVIKPSVRLVVLGMRQNLHGIHVDREEMGKAGAKLVERGTGQNYGSDAATQQEFEKICATNATTGALEYTADYKTVEMKTLEVRCGSESKPSPAYTDLDIDKGHYARPYADFIQAIGKNLGLRGTTIAYNDYIGKHSANRVDKFRKEFGFGDRGPLFFIPLLLPSGSLQNVLTIDATLSAAPGAKAEQELVVMTVNDELWNMKYAPPAELPLSTSSRPLL